MERELETLFDTVEGLQASIVDVHQLSNLCREQQALSMRRVATWVRSRAKTCQLEWDTQSASELKGLSDELEYLADIALMHQE